MQGTIVNYRMGRHHQTDNHMVITVPGMDSKEKAAKLVGKEVIYKTQTGKDIKGKVASSHGNKGAIRVIFEKGMPGQSLSKKVDIKA